MTASLFYKDVAGQKDAVIAAVAQRIAGLAKRATYMAESHTVDMMGRLHSDIFFQDSYMLNEVTTKIKLMRSKDAFCIMSANAFAMKIVSAIIYVRKVKLSPSVFLAHAKVLEHTNAKYPIC